MVDEIVAASITINSDRTSGSKISNTSSKDTQLLQKMLKEFKNMNNTITKSSKMGMSGLSGGILGKLLGTVNGVVAGGAALIGGALTSELELERKNDGTGYQKALVDGEEKIIKINTTNGKILDVLTYQEARDLGILNLKGDIIHQHTLTKKELKKLNDKYKFQQDKMIITSQQVEAIASLEYAHKLQLEEQNRIQKIINQRLADRANIKMKTESVDTFTSSFNGAPYAASYLEEQGNLLYQSHLNTTLNPVLAGLLTSVGEAPVIFTEGLNPTLLNLE